MKSAAVQVNNETSLGFMLQKTGPALLISVVPQGWTSPPNDELWNLQTGSPLLYCVHDRRDRTSQSVKPFYTLSPGQYLRAAAHTFSSPLSLSKVEKM